MNEGGESSQVPKPFSPDDFVVAKPPLQGSLFIYWLKRFLACNPFYLVSAALLLYGVYRVSVDPNFLSRETAQLVFNFTSLQFYEVLLVLTAIFLARRRIWYDSTLLVVLENGLLLVPFILISQAALIGKGFVWAMCLAGGFLVLARFAGLKRGVGELNFPPRLALIGLAVLAANVALPAVYRILHESKVGTKPDFGAAYQMNQYAWELLLPALCGLAFFVPRIRNTGELLPQRGWLPPGLFLLWIAATGVHLFCLGYVYDFDVRRDLVAPAIWMLLWAAHRRLSDFKLNPNWQKALLLPPLLTTFLAYAGPKNEVFLMLTILNSAVYGSIGLFQRDQRLALRLSFISLLALIGGLPEDWGQSVLGEFSRAKGVGLGMAGYCLLWAAFSRGPKHGIFGGIVAATVAIIVTGERADTLHWAIEIGLAFLLLHSLRWEDSKQQGAATLRALAGILWVAHGFAWTHLGGTAWMTGAVATPVLLGWLAAHLWTGRWEPRWMPLAALLVAMSGPGGSTFDKLQTTPVGPLAVAGSFVLFGLGTLAALTKHRWHRPEAE